MQTMNARTITLLAKRLAPEIAAHLVVRSRPSDAEVDLEELLTEAASAAILGLRPGTLANWRARGHGPHFLRLGTKRRAPIRYKRSAILEYRDRGIVNPKVI